MGHLILMQTCVRSMEGLPFRLRPLQNKRLLVGLSGWQNDLARSRSRESIFKDITLSPSPICLRQSNNYLDLDTSSCSTKGKSSWNFHQRNQIHIFLKDPDVDSHGHADVTKHNSPMIEGHTPASGHPFTFLSCICKYLLGLFSIYYLWKNYQISPWLTTAKCHSKNSAEKFGNLPGQQKSASCHCDYQDGSQSDQHRVDESNVISLQQAIEKTKHLLEKKKVEEGIPGIVVCVSIDGKFVCAKGLGHADVENQVPIHPHSVLRIASISKSMTAAMAARLVDNGLLDLDKSVYEYVPKFPAKEFRGEKVDITVRQLLNHTSGIRSYWGESDPVASFQPSYDKMVALIGEVFHKAFYSNHSNKFPITQKEEVKETKGPTNTKTSNKDLRLRPEYYSQKVYHSTGQALEMFSNDRLWAKPGTRYIYSTLAYTLLSAVLESVSNKSFPVLSKESFQLWGLKETYLDQNDPLIFNRARSYTRKGGRLVNVPYVDVSYKWAGGGFLSSAMDVVKFGNILLYSRQHNDEDQGLHGYLKQSTIREMWTAIPQKRGGIRYGEGFELYSAKESLGMCPEHPFLVGHTGAAVGVSSVVYILPRQKSAGSEKIVEGTPMESKGVNSSNPCAASSPTTPSLSTPASRGETSLPRGVVVAVIANLIEVDLREQAKEIAVIFDKVKMDQATKAN